MLLFGLGAWSRHTRRPKVRARPTIAEARWGSIASARSNRPTAASWLALGVGEAAITFRPTTHGKIDRVGVVRMFAHRAQAFGFDELHPERIGEARDAFDLQF